MPVRHPLSQYDFDEIYAGLEYHRQKRHVVKQTQPKTGLELWVYTPECTYTKAWNDFTRSARGLVVHPANKKIVALPFPKFFNYGENGYVLPNLEYETTEKLDGSLGIVWHWGGKWHVSTTGSFQSEQAKWGLAWFTKNVDHKNIPTELTLLFEIIYPENRIVVPYSFRGMVFLSAYNRDTGEEILYHPHFENSGFPLVPRHSQYSLHTILEVAKELPPTSEGFVVRFIDGTRVKIKGDEYCRLHRVLSGVTPLNVWDILRKCDNIDIIRRELPEEFQSDLDSLTRIFMEKYNNLVLGINKTHRATKKLSDKELGKLRQDDGGKNPFLKFIFEVRKNNFLAEIKSPGRARDELFGEFRPTGNKLEGYTPSTSMNRFQDG